MKFLCVECDEQMTFQERQLPGDGTLAAVFLCPGCERAVGLLTNPMETQLVSSLGVKVGGREVPEQPMEMARSSIREGREDAFSDAASGPVAPETGSEPRVPDGANREEGTDPSPRPEGSASGRRVVWSEAARQRLQAVPSFVRGMVRRIYTDYARERQIEEITPDVMDRARSDLGLEGM